MASYQGALDDESSVQETLLSDFLDLSDTAADDEEDDDDKPHIEDLLLRSDPTNSKDRKALHKNITKNYSTKAVAIIFILHLKVKNIYDYQKEENKDQEEDPKEKLEMIQKARNLFENEIFNSRLKLVKYDDIRIFAVSDDPIAAMRGMLCAKKWVGNISSPTMSMKISAGCERGTLFVIKNDYFGDPVNVASKLAEDTAKAGDLFVSLGNGSTETKYIKSFQEATFKPTSVHISGVDISYYIMEEKIQRKLFCAPSKKRSGLLSTQPSEKSFTSRKAKTNLQWQELIFLQSDLSGFTRLTKKYGILHFLTIIMHCREIFNKHLEAISGATLLMYDGDNIIIKFDSCTVALRFILHVTRDLDDYNDKKERDFHIRAKFGLAKGKVLVTDDGDIAGEAWEHCCTLSEDKAEVGEILVTEMVKQDLERDLYGCKFDLREASEGCPQHYNVST